MLRGSSVIAVVVMGLARLSSAQVQPPDYDFQWRTIGAPGNRAANQAEAPHFYPPYSTPAIVAGAVNYQYRMSRTEVTATQWLEFVNTYWPYYTGSYNDPAFTSFLIDPTSIVPGQNPGYHIRAGYDNMAVDISWRFAARYANWLTNAQATNQAAFESGAYDTSTFTQNPDGSLNDQPTNSPGALFWIPTLDEWTKSMYWDPNKGGPGVGGYWLYPTTSDTPPISGLPGVGQTSAGLPLSVGLLPVGSYPSVQSPWGLLDGSGSVSEWTEYFPGGFYRGIKGSSQGQPVSFDRIDEGDGERPWIGGPGLRLASQVPGPGAASLLLFVLAPITQRSRRCISIPLFSHSRPHS